LQGGFLMLAHFARVRQKVPDGHTPARARIRRCVAWTCRAPTWGRVRAAMARPERIDRGSYASGGPTQLIEL